MPRFKRISGAVFATLLFVTALSAPAEGLPATLYQSSYQQTITDGVTLEHLSRFTSDGWLNIKVLRIDTENPNVQIDTLANNRITDKPLTIPGLAEAHGAIAAVNAGFFNSLGEGKAYPDGPVVKNGELLTTPGWYNKSKNEMASLSLTNSGQIFFHYWKNDLILSGPDNTEFTVSQYNQPSRKNYQDITVWDSKWAELSLGASETYPDLVEIVVAQGRIKEIRRAMPAVEIPTDGFVVISRGEQAAKLLQNLKLNDKVEFKIYSSPDWTDLQMSASGASILVKDGKIPESFSYQTNSFNRRNPRTLAGTSREGRELILVTVDGRQDNSIGLTQTEAAELMLELGAYNALILDGGGSTTMVARKPGTTLLEVVNVPSEGALRAVTNGIGVFSRYSSGYSSLPLAKLIIETEDTNIFNGTSREFTLRGVDRYANPVELDLTQVRWTVKGIAGRFENNVFYPESVGKGKIIARIGEIEAEIEIKTLDAPVKIALSPGTLNVRKGQEQPLQITGYDEEGFSALIRPEDVSFKLKGEIGEIVAGTFKATYVGTGYIEAAVGDIVAYSAVTVFTEEEEILSSFENADQISGQFSGEQVYRGNGAGKLTYDFYGLNTLTKVFLPFNSEGLKLKAGTTHLAIWVYNEAPNENTVGAEIVDAAGNKHYLKFASGLNWSGWKQLKTSLEGISDPLSVSAIYIENTDPNTTWGQIYLDELTAIESRHPVIDRTQIPENTVFPDKANRKVDFTPGENNYKFVVGAGWPKTDNPSPQQLKSSVARLTDYLNKNIELAVGLDAKAAETFSNWKKQIIIAGNDYGTYNFKNSSFIRLNVSEGGLRRTDPAQWTWLFEELDKLPGENIFLVINGDPTNFINAKEAQLLKDTLAEYRNNTGKNVWVFHPGSLNKSELDRGVRYISTTGLSKAETPAEQPETITCLEVTVKGNELTFQFLYF